VKKGIVCVLLVLVLAVVACKPVALQAGYTIKGTILDKNGSPVSGSTVYVENTNIKAETAADGSYTLFPVPYGSWKIIANKQGLVFVPSREDGADAPVVFCGTSREVVLNFKALNAGEVTIPMVQGKGLKSPLEGQKVERIIGVVTMITRRAPHAIYDTILYDGSTTPQWISEDGFYMEAYGSYKDGDPATSDGIFVYTHNDAYVESKWLNTVPQDLKVGDVVAVSGVVREYVPVDRFLNSEGYLSVTRIEEPLVLHVTSNGIPQTAPFPAGVLLTYEDNPGLPSGVTEYRTMPWTDVGPLALARAIAIQESVEGMVVRVNNPLAATHTYYNVTGILADEGKKGGVDNPNLNTTWGGIVLQDPKNAGGMDFNSEILFCDYQSPTWKTFDPLPQTGDKLKDSTGAFVLRGVMDYTADGIYMIRPLQHTDTVRDSANNIIPAQGWDFNAKITSPDMKNLSSANRTTIRNWRIGASADPRFRVPASWGPTPEAGYIKVASFNFENYEAQGTAYGKVNDIADIIVYNLRCPDVVISIEMGDDVVTKVVYENQWNAYAIPDGVVTAVRNYRTLIDTIKSKSGIQYDFRCIDPEEGKDGGAPGVNIRVGFLFRTDTLQFVDRGLPTNHMENTGGFAGPTAAESTWPVTFPSPLATTLATQPTAVYKAKDGSPALVQSPGRIITPGFAGSTRKPLAGEFIHKATGKKLFVIAAHLGSKRGDTPLYGAQQPPVFGSDARRVQSARELAQFIAQILDIDPNANIVIGGDMNDFQFADSLLALEGAQYGRRVLWSFTREFMPANEQFSYAFRGNLQQIDHILVSPNLYQKALSAFNGSNWTDFCFIAHIDSPFSKNNHIQTSDHDALIYRLNIGD